MSKTTLMREWAESVMNSPIGSREQAEVLAAEHVLATTTEPTMADVKWSDEKHFLAGATHKETNAPLVMIGPAMGDKTTDCVALSLNCGYQVENRDLTPNGKKYELREVGAGAAPEHPETLTTEEDYENAPEGTVVAAGRVWVKCETGDWRTTKMSWSRMDHHMKGAERRVLRWGWGE